MSDDRPIEGFKGDFFMKMPYTITNNSITLVRNGMPVTVLRDSPAYELILEAVKNDNWEQVIELLDSKTTVKIITDGEVEERDGELFVKTDQGTWWKVPMDLADHIINFYANDLPYKPWVAFAKKLQQNTSYRSVQELFRFLDANSFTLTEDGNFIAYKRVTNDFKDIYTKTIDNSVGLTVSVARNEVDEDSERTCSHGLHVAAFDYACNSYGSDNRKNDKLLYVEVNPKDVVAVPKDYNNQKMRVCEYKILGVCDYEFKEPLYSEDQGFYGSNSSDFDEYESWEDENGCPECSEECDNCGYSWD